MQKRSCEEHRNQHDYRAAEQEYQYISQLSPGLAFDLASAQESKHRKRQPAEPGPGLQMGNHGPGDREPADLDEIERFVGRMNSGGVAVLLVHDANPVYSMPAGLGFDAALEKVGFVVSFASLPELKKKQTRRGSGRSAARRSAYRTALSWR